MHLEPFFLVGAASTVTATQYFHSRDFRVGVDPDTGTLLSIVHPKDNASMSWISGPENTPWQLLGSGWGLSYADLVYELDGLTVGVTRRLDDRSESLEECYSFTNTGREPLTLNNAATEAFAIYTPFNDHYTSTEDVLENRAHAHIWANGGASSWVKLTRMGLRGPHLGLVLTEGEECCDFVEHEGVFLLHPSIPTLESRQSSRVCWSLFWHDDWEDFFEQAAERSSQFLRVEASSWTAVVGETVNLTVSRNNAKGVSSEGLDFTPAGKKGSYQTSIKADKPGEKTITFSTSNGESQHNSTIVLNVVPDIDDLIASRIKFITIKQQLSTDFSDQTKAGAYARVGMGVLIARWLQANPDLDVETSLRIYYDYVNKRLQSADGYVHSWPIGSRVGSLRLYNWPWVIQLHLQLAKLGNKATTSHGNYTATPSERLIHTIERFYEEEEAIHYYPINLPIYESLKYFKEANDTATVARLQTLFEAHGRRIAAIGPNYPSSEVNYEQSIIAPAAIILLELYRSTGNKTYLSSAHGHFNRLEAFSGRQPDFHLHDIAIRHWDGYWFGKDWMWGDTFPHYWSTLTAIAMHHYANATGETGYAGRAEGILMGSLVLFDREGRGYCAFIYPTSVEGKRGHYLDPYANDQDWALAHLLALRGS
ncbi:hypothetical protein BJX70DRAFT_405983 [Aspergillus crustosus]